MNRTEKVPRLAHRDLPARALASVNDPVAVRPGDREPPRKRRRAGTCPRVSAIESEKLPFGRIRTGVPSLTVVVVGRDVVALGPAEIP